jgi:hypothetical protein
MDCFAKTKKYVNIHNDAEHNFKSNDCYVYELSIDNKVFYVGKGKGDRCVRHIWYRNNKRVEKSNPHLYRRIRLLVSQGRTIDVRIVFSSHLADPSFEHERLLIERYGRLHVNGGILLNLNAGGEGNTNPGKPVSQFDMFGEFIADYDSAKSAARDNGWEYYSTIAGCCRGNESSYKGFLWAYKGEQPTLLTYKRIVYQWDVETRTLIAKYESVSAAGKSLNVDPSTISDNIRGNTTSVRSKFVFSHESEFPKMRTNKKKKKVIHIETGRCYQSVTEAANDLGHNIGAISACCKGTRPSVGGNHFKYM